MNVALTPENLSLFVGIFGPLIVAAITGLKTPGKVKALIAVGIITALTAVQIFVGNMWGADLVTNISMVVAVWGGFYQLWKGTEVAKWLQENIPVYLGQAKVVTDVVEDTVNSIDEIVKEAPVQTDNSARPNDGEQPADDEEIVLDADVLIDAEEVVDASE